MVEGVVLEHVPMGGGTKRDESLIVKVGPADRDKNIDALDIEIPRLSRRYARERRQSATRPLRTGDQWTHRP